MKYMFYVDEIGMDYCLHYPPYVTGKSRIESIFVCNEENRKRYHADNALIIREGETKCKKCEDKHIYCFHHFGSVKKYYFCSCFPMLSK